MNPSTRLQRHWANRFLRDQKRSPLKANETLSSYSSRFQRTSDCMVASLASLPATTWLMDSQCSVCSSSYCPQLCARAASLKTIGRAQSPAQSTLSCERSSPLALLDVTILRSNVLSEERTRAGRYSAPANDPRWTCVDMNQRVVPKVVLRGSGGRPPTRIGLLTPPAKSVGSTSAAPGGQGEHRTT